MTDAPAVPHTLATHLVPLRKNRGWLMGAGVVLILLGMIGLVMPLVFTIASALSFGALMLIGGGVLLVDSFRCEGWKSRILMLLVGALYVLAGALAFYDPAATAIGLTHFVGAIFAATGVLRIIMALQLRPASIWIWVLASGVLSLLLAALILYSWPKSSTWVLGTFLAIELIFQGWAYIILAQAIRSTFDGVTPKTA
jgi:uncharacterized membrane protein HdeD (DUF308 family)